MNTSPWLGDEDKVRFSDAVEGSYRVSSRPQFFEWNQSLVHALVPHEILICGIEDGSRQGMALHRHALSVVFCCPGEGARREER